MTAPGPQVRRGLSPVSITLIVVAGLLLGALVVAAGVFTVRAVASDPFSLWCSPPSQHDKDVQEDFVRKHLVDAAGLEWDVSDCDEDGAAFLDFTTALTPAAARAAFLADSGCSEYAEEEGDEDVTCWSAGTDVYIFFEDEPAGTRTSAYLTLD